MIFDRLCADLPVHSQWKINHGSPSEGPGSPVVWKLGKGGAPLSKESQVIFNQIQLVARRLFDPELCQGIRDVRRHATCLEDLPPLLDEVFKERSR